jgi:small subunit ribosomal protein S14
MIDMAKMKPKKKREFGRAARPCKRCGQMNAVIHKYGLDLCRQCFREVAKSLGFEKYS